MRKIGVFDSGMGGLSILKSVTQELPEYDYIFFGDTKHVPYGEKSQARIYALTKKAVQFLFEQDCQIVILACNTASAKALRKLQQQWLPKYFPDRRILGMVVPTLEQVIKRKNIKRLGLLATRATVDSGVYRKELRKLTTPVRLFQRAAPKLVPLIEDHNFDQATVVLENYLQYFQQRAVDALIMGSTHYSLLKRQAKKIMGSRTIILSQDEIIPGRVAWYLRKHPKLRITLDQKHRRQFFATKVTPQFTKAVRDLFGPRATLREVKV